MLTAEAIRAGLGTESVGQKLIYLPETGSTNDEARRLAQVGAPDGLVVVTDYQTAGRGRLGRHWLAPAGSSLLLSVILRPSLAPYEIQQLTMICSLAIADAVESQTGLRVGLKWPNDLLLGRGKVGGILTEIGLVADRVDYAIVGVGLNVNIAPEQLPSDLLMQATSLSQVVGRSVARLPLLCALLEAVEARYLALQAGLSPYEEWARRLVTLGQPVMVSAPLSRPAREQELVDGLEGVAEGVDVDGALLVRLADGRLERVVAGDVTLHRKD
jgi:BirA family biotin operon repressor/biotin-[acetyl-CoA-carboxylase] ligase